MIVNLKDQEKIKRVKGQERICQMLGKYVHVFELRDGQCTCRDQP